MLLAGIDAGSNTVRLLIGRVLDGRVVPHRYHRRISRLAGGLSPEQGLASDARQRTLAVCHEFAALCADAHVEAIRAVGTAAFRNSINGDDFARQVRAETRLPLQVIHGDEEARLTAAGALSALDPLPASSLIFDIGGGSTEWVLCRGRDVLWSQSAALGVVALSEAYDDPDARKTAIDKSVRTLLCDLRPACQAAELSWNDLTLVGTAGTVTTLAALDMRMTAYDWRKVNNYRLSQRTLTQQYADLLPLTPRQREALPGIEAGRGDLITVGLEIVLTLLENTGLSGITVSDFGLLEGVLGDLHKSVSCPHGVDKTASTWL